MLVVHCIVHTVLVHKKVGNSIYLCMYNTLYFSISKYKAESHEARLGEGLWGRIGRIIHNSSNDKSKETRFFFSFLVTFRKQAQKGNFDMTVCMCFFFFLSFSFLLLFR